MHEVLVNRLGGLGLPRKSVVRLTDRPDMTLDVYRGRKTTIQPELQIIFTVVSVFTKENVNPYSNLISPFGIDTHEIQWLFSIFLTHNWSPIYLLNIINL